MNAGPCGFLLVGQDGRRIDRQALAAQLRARRGGGLALTPACVTGCDTSNQGPKPALVARQRSLTVRRLDPRRLPMPDAKGRLGDHRPRE